MKKLYRKICMTVAALFLTANVLVINGTSLAVKIEASGEIPQEVSVGGMPFGVKFYSQGIVIVGFMEIETTEGVKTPAYDAGLRINDIITHINGAKVGTSEELIKYIEENNADEIEVTYLRGGNENKVKFTPALSSTDGKLKTGMWIRDTTAGIGTITYIVPETGEFAGLGHGICDAESGELLKMESGTVVDVKISGIVKGIAGTPGELKGYFTSDNSGVLLGNTSCGVYGVLTDIPDMLIPEEHIEIGNRREVHTGEAYIWCTLDDNVPQKYEIEIDEIHYKSNDNRSFSITIDDEDLIEKTGGIVQGMSGSPIIQDGKLIGAVTHVLIGDPKKGYGIFIENMLNAAG
ncbi:MAG: SpoIVB peptidase [Ruminococcaceae bacterium]|nr:SpoIVB peptidase [Oscillospiraceae bacterium]